MRGGRSRTRNSDSGQNAVVQKQYLHCRIRGGSDAKSDHLRTEQASIEHQRDLETRYDIIELGVHVDQLIASLGDEENASAVVA